MQSLDDDTEKTLRVAAEARLAILEEAVRAHRGTRVPTAWTLTERQMFKLLPEATPHRQ